MTITPSTLIRTAAVAAVAAGVIFIGVQINHPHSDVAAVTTIEWAVRNSLKVLMGALALAGITGMYLRQVKQIGLLDLLGYVLLLDVLREDDHAHARMLGPDSLRGLNALVRVGERHPDGGKNRVGRVLGDELDQRVRVGRAGYQVDAVDLSEQRGDSLPDEVVVVREDDPQRRVPVTVQAVAVVLSHEGGSAGPDRSCCQPHRRDRLAFLTSQA